MKTIHLFAAAAALALGTGLALAQDEQKPVQPPPPPPAPDSANRPTDAGPQQNTPPPPQGRHHDRHDGGPRPPDDDRRGDRSEGDGWRRPPGFFQMPVPAPSKPTPYIGVITTPPPAVLSAQLGLSEGFGLVVSDVLPDSPAAKAGVQRYDVLTKFNDQQLVDSGQFSTLVRALKKDTEASLTLVRKAQEQKVTVKIDERLLPERRSFPYPGGFPGGDMRRMQNDFDRGPMDPHRQDKMRAYGEKMREFQDRMKDWQKNPSAEKPKPPEPPSGDGAAIQPEDILREVRPGGVARIRLLRPDGAVTYNMANARLVMKDDSGEVELTMHDGKRSLVARNAQGETIFDGPIDTEDQRKGLPEDVRKKIETIEVQRKLAEAPAPSVDPGLLPDVQ
jgi:hypothetical protein